MMDLLQISHNPGSRKRTGQIQGRMRLALSPTSRCAKTAPRAVKSKGLSFYVTDADVTIRSDHLPLKKFLNKQTMNSKVNNWAVELEQFRLHLEWIPGSRNLLADSLRNLIDVIPATQQPGEPKDHEFGSYCFEELEPAKVMEVISTEVIEMQVVTSEVTEDLLKSWKLPVIGGTVLRHEEKQGTRREPSVDDSESSDPSQNSRIPSQVGTFVLNYEEKTLKKQSLLNSSKSSKPSRKSRIPALKLPKPKL